MCNQLSQRQKIILRHMISKNQWVKSTDLANRCKVTKRTIGNDIASLNLILQAIDAKIVSSRKNGYKLEYIDVAKINLLMVDIEDVPNTPEDRLRSISIILLRSSAEEPMVMEDLAEEYFISTSTLEANVRKIKETLERRDNPLSVCRKGGKIWVDGDEEIRRFLLKELILDCSDPNYLDINNYNKVFEKGFCEKVLSHVKSAMMANRMNIMDFDMFNFLIYLCIKIERIKAGYTLPEQPNDDYSTETKIDVMATALFDHLSKAYSFVKCDSELHDLSYQLSFLQMFINNEGKTTRVCSFSNDFSDSITKSLLEHINDRFGIDLMNDNELKTNLSVHISQIIHRINIVSSEENNPVLDLLKIEYPFIFEMSLFLYEQFLEIFHVKLSEDELGYITSYLGAAIERNKNQNSREKMSIAVVSSYNYSSTSLLMARLISAFGEKYNIVGPFSTLNAEDILASNAKLLIKCGNFSTMQPDMQVVEISPNMNVQDYYAINKTIERNKMVNSILSNDIISLFSEEVFIKPIWAKDKEEVIRIMSDVLFQCGYVPAGFDELTLQREKLSSTDMAHGIAIPHPIPLVAKKTIIATGILDKPIAWGEGVGQLIFLLAVKAEDAKYMEGFFRLTAELVDNKTQVDKLIASKDYNEFVSYLK